MLPGGLLPGGRSSGATSGERRVFFPEAGPPELRVFFPEAGPPELGPPELVELHFFPEAGPPELGPPELRA